MAELKTKVLENLLCCPSCYSELHKTAEAVKCVSGHGPFLVDKEGRPHFLLGRRSFEYQKEHLRGINWLKSFLKRFPRLYYLIWHIFCPVLMSGRGPRSVRTLVPEGAIMLNLGSGPRRIGKEFINVDIFPFPEVDVVADVHRLPFRDSSLDAVINESLLEHVSDPIEVVKEISRVIKPGGLLYTSTPFLTPYHASPDDFNRWTQSGLRVLFSDFKPMAEGVHAGPWSALLVFLAYFIGVIFSLGSKKIAPFLAFLFMLILGPLKIFDFIFARLPGAEVVAAQLFFLGRRK